MFIYILLNKLFIGQPKKVILNFPMPDWMRTAFKTEGWEVQETNEWLR